MNSDSGGVERTGSPSRAAVRATMIAGPCWWALAIVAQSNRINSAGLVVYLAVLTVLLFPYALVIGYLVAPKLIGPIRQQGGSLAAIGVATVALAFAGAAGYRGWQMLATGAAPAWLMIPFYLALFTVVPGYAGCVAYAVSAQRNSDQ